MQTLAHKLAAIVFTDIVGYTATTQVNEQKAWSQVRKHEEAIESCTQQYGGEVLNYYGDGSLATFSSVTNAIEAAGKIQEKMQEWPRVPLRIGIHLGEIHFKDGKYLGDGINIASRIQSEAEEGQIYVSETVYQMAKNKPNFRFEALGESSLKNVDRPVKIHRVKVIGYMGASTQKKSTKKSPWIYWVAGLLILAGVIFYLGRRTAAPSNRVTNQVPSILILPFEEQYPGDEENYFGIGVADEIRSKLSSFRQLEVKSRSSSLFLQDKNWSAKEIADQLEVQYILEGSIRQQDDQVYLNLSLIDAREDHLIQPIDYRGGLNTDFIGVQNEIARTVIELIKITLLPDEQEKLTEVATDNFEAYKYYLMGLNYLYKGSLQEYQNKAEQYFRQAIQEDSGLVVAYAGLTEALMFGAGFGYKSTAEALENARPFAEKAYQMDPSLAKTNQVMGTIYLFSGNFIQAEEKLKQAIEIDPSHELSYAYLAFIYRAMERFDLALDHMNMAIRLHPFSPPLKYNYFKVFIEAGRIEEAIAVIDSFLLDYPTSNILLFGKGLALTLQGAYDEAIETFLSRPVETKAFNWVLGYTYGLKGDTVKAREVLDYLLEKAEKTYISPSQIACVYLGLGDMEKVYEWFEKEDSIYFKLFPMFRELRYDPRLKNAFAFMQPFLD
ncbi:MAG: tetratricopeptide repeat protein [Saprospiraceae bacterium]|nr:tetratricopeptide repeat protein [Saprospiraceae bacterium]